MLQRQAASTTRIFAETHNKLKNERNDKICFSIYYKRVWEMVALGRDKKALCIFFRRKSSR
jgi:hypothetical protein